MLSALMNEKKQEYVKIILRSVNEIMLEIYIYIYKYIYLIFLILVLIVNVLS